MAETKKKSGAAKAAPTGSGGPHEPPNIADLVEAVRAVVGSAVDQQEIRKELKLNAYNVNMTATAFLDSECS